jgi:SpoVK/Ycf46/Vps4 family AAA+-type ATPase
MNHTGRHGIDIKLNDGMDFTQLQHIIYKEELDDIHIIPQNQRILIFEDIDALGEVVKDRGLAAGTGKAGSNASVAGASASASGAGASASGAGSSASVAGSNASGAGDDAANELKMLSSFFKMTSANTTNDTKHNNNLSCLLNMIDGIHECSGRIIIMTTNKPEVLDKALIRPGRVDIKIHFQKCSRYDVMKMIEKFWNIELPLQEILPEVEGKYTCAEIINLFRSTDDFSEIKEIICLS